MSTFLLLLSIVHVFADPLPPGITLAGRGYNAMDGNPHDGNVDPGWKNMVFNLSVHGGGCLSHYTCPKGVEAEYSESNSCKQEENPIYMEMPGPLTYASQFPNLAIDLGGKHWKGALAGSSYFQTVIDGTKNNDYVFISNYFICTWYKAQFGSDCQVDPQFYHEVKNNLPTEYNSTTIPYFLNFFLQYGTHSVYQVMMGCVQGQLSQMTSWNYSKFISSNLNPQHGATYSLYYNKDAEKQYADDFRNSCYKQYNFTRGTPVPNGNYSRWEHNCTQNPVPIEYNMVEIAPSLSADVFKDINNIGKKQKALQNATDDYCNQYALAYPDQTFNCSGWPKDPKMPNGSIVLGFYADEATGWDEPVNPYTGARSCMSGTENIHAFGLINPANPNQTVDVFMCLENNFKNKTDPLYYFGGMYSNGSLKYPNHLAGGIYGCPAGYTDYMFMNCDSRYPRQCIEPHFCYNKSVSLDKSVIGGVFSTTENDGDSNCFANNPYTKKQTCPNGFDQYRLGTTYCGSRPGYYSTLYICFNDIYIIYPDNI